MLLSLRFLWPGLVIGSHAGTFVSFYIPLVEGQKVEAKASKLAQIAVEHGYAKAGLARFCRVRLVDDSKISIRPLTTIIGSYSATSCHEAGRFKRNRLRVGLGGTYSFGLERRLVRNGAVRRANVARIPTE